MTFAFDPPVSEAQRRAMFAAAEGKSTLGIPKWVGREYVGHAKDHAAGVALRAPDGALLFMRRTGSPAGTWALPGGLVEKGETPEQAARRELAEETGHGHDGPMAPMDRRSPGDGLVFHTFEARVPERFAPAMNGEHDGYVWARPENAPQPLHPGVKATLARDASQRAISSRIAAEVKKGHDPKQAAAIAYAELGEDMQPGELEELAEGLERFFREEAREPEHAFDEAVAFAGAMDRMAFGRGAAPLFRAGLAFDRDTARAYDRDGRLRVEANPISKAAVNEYLGREINAAMANDPDWKPLEPERRYRLLRDPKELERAAPTFNNLPVLSRHVPATADQHPTDLVIGATGTDASFDAPYLKNSLVLWRRDGIDDVESDRKKELSSAYRYTADMTPGTFEGEPYDGVMRNIIGNHVALVREGRAGSDVVVGDEAIPRNLMEKFTMSKTVLTRFGALASGAAMAYLAPRLAQDAKPVDVGAIFAGVTKANFKDKRPAIVAAIKAAAKLRDGMALDDMPESLAKLDDAEVAEGADTDPNSGLPMTAEQMKDKRAAADAEPGEVEKKVREILAAHGVAKEVIDRAVEALGARANDGDHPPAFNGEPNRSGVKAEDVKKAVDAAVEETKKEMKGAMDQAIEGAVKGERDRLAAIREAEEFVRPWVGRIGMACDSAEQVYRTALGGLGVKADDVKEPSALRHILSAQPKPGHDRRESAPAMDAAAAKTFDERFGTGRIAIL